MADDAGTIERLARFLTHAIAPLARAVRNPDDFRHLWSRLGWQVSMPPAAYLSLGVKVDAATLELDGLPTSPPIADVLLLAKAVSDAFSEMSSIAAVPAGIVDPAYTAEIRSRLFELLMTEALSVSAPEWFRGLALLGAINDVYLPATATRPAYVRTALRWDALPEALRDPSGIPLRAFDWGGPSLRFGKLSNVLAELFFAWGFPVSLERPPLALLAALGVDAADRVERPPHSVVVPFFNFNELEANFRLHGLPAGLGQLPGVAIDVTIPDAIARVLKLSKTIALRVRGKGFNEGVAFVLRPGQVSAKLLASPAAPFPSGGVGVGFDFMKDAPTVLVGAQKASRLEFAGASIDLGAEFSNGAWSIALGAELKGLAFVLNPGEGDGFLRFLIGGSPTTIGLPLALRWSGAEGIRFGGSAGFEVVVHPHVAIGPASIDEIDFRLRVPDVAKPRVDLEVGAGISGGIGPVSFVLAGVGLRAEITFEPGNIGPFDIGIGFKAPNGVGVSIDGGGFRGGGGLNYDRDKGEYSGTLELTFAEVISVRAVGILTTRLPDGSDTFSLLLIIVSEFVPIQLSYGFTLLGVGGLLGLNRTVDLDALQVGVRDGTLNSILFPTDVVANAPRIISDLKRVFPPRDDRFLIGPMGKLGWGTPTLMSVEIGLLLEIPRLAFAIIGVLRVQLPAEEFGTIYIQVNFSGSVDFEKGQLQFDASLYNSRILIDPITGDMALRIYWGGDPNFLLTVGGFHPAYTPPPMNIGTLERVGFVLVAGIPMVRAEIYLAITSNSVQFGARVEILYGVSFFNVFGFVELDVLIQFNPFMFIAEITAMFGVRSGSEILFGIRVTGTLRGPTPWNVRGEASFEIGFIVKARISANFEVTAGETRNTLLPTIDVLGEIRKAVDNVGNWRAVLPNGANQHVSLRELPQVGAALVLHPFGALEINQKIAPLNIALQRFGSTRPASGSVFKIASAQINKAIVVTVPTTEQFAPAQFFEMSDAEKLSRPSFARYDSGLLIGADNAPQTDFCRARDAQYEVIYLPEHQSAGIIFRLTATLFNAFGRGNAAAQSSLSQQSRAPSAVAAEHVSVSEEHYAVVSTHDMTLHAGPLVFASATAADQAVAQLIAARPELTDAIQVVPSAQIRRVA